MAEILKNFLDIGIDGTGIPINGDKVLIASVEAQEGEQIVLRNINSIINVPEEYYGMGFDFLEFRINDKKIATQQTNTKVVLEEPYILDSGDKLEFYAGFNYNDAKWFRPCFVDNNNHVCVESTFRNPNSELRNILAKDTSVVLPEDDTYAFMFTYNGYTYVWQQSQTIINSVDGGPVINLLFTPQNRGAHFYKGFLYFYEADNIVAVDLSDMSRTTIPGTNNEYSEELMGWGPYLIDLGTTRTRTNNYKLYGHTSALELNYGSTSYYKINTNTKLVPVTEDSWIIVNANANNASGLYADYYDALTGTSKQVVANASRGAGLYIGGSLVATTSNRVYNVTSSSIKTDGTFFITNESGTPYDSQDGSFSTTWVVGDNGMNNASPDREAIDAAISEIKIIILATGVVVS